MPRPAAEPPAISLVLPLLAPQPDLGQYLAAWGRQMAPGDEILLICQADKALAQAQTLAAEAPARVRVLSQPPGQPWPEASARALALAEGQGQVLLCSLPACQPGPDLLALLRQAFAQDDLAALAGVVLPLSATGTPAQVAGLELSWQQAGVALPSPACLALGRRAVLECGGLDAAWPGPGDLWELWRRLQRAGRRLEQDEQAQVFCPQPATWGGLLARAVQQGRALFLGRRLGVGAVLGQDRPAGQVLLVLAALGLLIALWGPAPERAWSLAAICLLLLYPANRPFLRWVAQEEPGLMGACFVYCLLRPWAWTAGLVAAALTGLGRGRAGTPINSG